MFSNVKNKLQAVKQHVSEGLKLFNDSGTVVDGTGFHLLAGSELLTHYEAVWSDQHNILVQNVHLSQEIERNLASLNTLSETRCNNLELLFKLSYQMEPLTDSVEQLASSLDALASTFHQLERQIVVVEHRMDTLVFERRKQTHLDELEVRRNLKYEHLHTLKDNYGKRMLARSRGRRAANLEAFGEFDRLASEQLCEFLLNMRMAGSRDTQCADTAGSRDTQCADTAGSRDTQCADTAGSRDTSVTDACSVISQQSSRQPQSSANIKEDHLVTSTCGIRDDETESTGVSVRIATGYSNDDKLSLSSGYCHGNNDNPLPNRCHGNSDGEFCGRCRDNSDDELSSCCHDNSDDAHSDDTTSTHYNSGKYIEHANTVMEAATIRTTAPSNNCTDDLSSSSASPSRHSVNADD